MSNVSVEYLVLRDNVEYSRLTAFKGGGAAVSVTADGMRNALQCTVPPPSIQMLL